MDLEPTLDVHIARLHNLNTPIGRIALRLLSAEAHIGDPARIAALLADTDVQHVLQDARLATDCGWRPTDLYRASPPAPPTDLSAELLAASAAPAPPAQRLTLYCDGSCSRNGQAGARAGFGVHVCRGEQVVHRHSAAVPAYEPQTNQRAELHAMHYALQYVREAGLDDALIVTDSKYAMDCLKTWAGAWAATGWVKADRKPIQHLDLIQPMYELYDGGRGGLELRHVRGHTGGADADSRGNAEADQLARAGAGL